MNVQERISELINQKSNERIFPILNKIDRVWSFYPNLDLNGLFIFLELNSLNDLKLSKKLDEIIDERANNKTDN